MTPRKKGCAEMIGGEIRAEPRHTRSSLRTLFCEITVANRRLIAAVIYPPRDGRQPKEASRLAFHATRFSSLSVSTLPKWRA